MRNAGEKRPDLRFALVQELRGFAALWVVLFHASAGGHLNALENRLPTIIDATMFKAGHYGVAVFFALSGFVIAHSLRNTNGSFKVFIRFIVKRSIRLDPPYWASIVFVLGVGYLASTFAAKPFSGVTISTVAAHAIYAQVIMGFPEINTVYWTLTYEIQFYIFYAFFLFVITNLTQHKKHRFLITAAYLLVFALAIMSALNILDFLPHGVFTNLWASFYVGVLAYRRQSSLSAQAAFFVLLIVMFLYPAPDNFARLSAATALLLAYALNTERIYAGLGWRWLQAVGLISYSLYLLHNPITGAVSFIIGHMMGFGLASAIVALIAIVGTSLIGALLFWWAIEKPAHRLSQAIS